MTIKVLKIIAGCTLFVLLVSTYSWCQEIKPKIAKSILDDLLTGEWLNEKFLSTLNKTKSPRQASITTYESSLKVLKEKEQYLVQVSYNFHDAGISLTFTDAKYVSANHYELVTGPPEEYSGIEKERIDLYKRPNADVIKWRFTNHNNGMSYDLQFIRVQPNVEQYVNSLLIAGEYVDQHNRKFKFTRDGMAIWPDKTFRYEIQLDFVTSPDEAACDSFVNVEIKNRKVKSVTSWDFLLANDKLYIYEPLKQGSNEYCSKKILHSLNRISRN